MTRCIDGCAGLGGIIEVMIGSSLEASRISVTLHVVQHASLHL
jgi:hypothetical protein